MKDIIITNSELRRELFIYLICFAAAFIVNVGAIIGYSRPWSELYSQLGYVIAISVLFYVALLILRVIFAGAASLFRKISNTKQ